MWKLVEGEGEKMLLLALKDEDMHSYGEMVRKLKEKYNFKLSKMGALKIFKKYEKLGVVKRKENGDYCVNKDRIKIKLFSTELIKDSVLPALIGFLIVILSSFALAENALWLLVGGTIVFVMQFLRFVLKVLTTTETRLVFVDVDKQGIREP